MSTSEEEMNETLNQLEVDGLDKSQFVEVVDQNQDQNTDIKPEPIVDEPEKKPPGFLTYEQWIEKGKDPADFRGEKAYSAQYESLQEVKELKNAMGQVVDSMETWKQQQNEQMNAQIEQARIDATADLERAKDDDDIAAALAAQDKINKLDKQPKPSTQTLNPVISEFASKNPIIDTASTQYSAEFHQDMINIHNNKLDQLLGGDRSKAANLTSDQILRVQNWAFNQTKDLHQEKFVSLKNKRVTVPPAKQRPVQSKGDTNTRLKAIKGSSKNPRDTNPANDIYEILKDRDPEAAETFAKNMLGDN